MHVVVFRSRSKLPDRKTTTCSEPSFAPDLTAFRRLDEIDLGTVGQVPELDRAVIEFLLVEMHPRSASATSTTTYHR